MLPPEYAKLDLLGGGFQEEVFPHKVLYFDSVQCVQGGSCGGEKSGGFLTGSGKPSWHNWAFQVPPQIPARKSHSKPACPCTVRWMSRAIGLYRFLFRIPLADMENLLTSICGFLHICPEDLNIPDEKEGQE